MKIIGLTGGIGSGKSTVSRFLSALGAVVVDADKMGHEALKPGTEVWQEVVAAFGKQILTSDGEVDRSKLAQIVFEDREALSRLNQIMHPRMYGMVKVRIEEYRKQGVKVTVLEAPLLLEAGWDSLVDEVWVTVAPESTVLKRLQERSGLSRAESLARLRSQMSNEERLKHADAVIENNDSLDELRNRIEKLWQGSY
ncbi:dephospho-CoA kinase [Chloroflexota bacterium]